MKTQREGSRSMSGVFQNYPAQWWVSGDGQEEEVVIYVELKVCMAALETLEPYAPWLKDGTISMYLPVSSPLLVLYSPGP